jgi:hypothetical protein
MLYIQTGLDANTYILRQTWITDFSYKIEGQTQIIDSDSRLRQLNWPLDSDRTYSEPKVG